MILNYFSPYILLKDNDMRSFLIVPNIKTHSMGGFEFHFEICYA